MARTGQIYMKNCCNEMYMHSHCIKNVITLDANLPEFSRCKLRCLSFEVLDQAQSTSTCKACLHNRQ